MKRLFWLVPAALVALADAWLKERALLAFPQEGSFIPNPIFSLILHRNMGIAFNIPIPLPLVLAVSAAIVGVLLWLAYSRRSSSPRTTLFALVVIIGAVGNMIDRAVHGFTVDYLLILGRSVINLSDLLILIGVAGLLFGGPRKERRKIDTEAKS